MSVWTQWSKSGEEKVLWDCDLEELIEKDVLAINASSPKSCKVFKTGHIVVLDAIFMPLIAGSGGVYEGNVTDSSKEVTESGLPYGLVVLSAYRKEVQTADASLRKSARRGKDNYCAPNTTFSLLLQIATIFDFSSSFVHRIIYIFYTYMIE